MKICCCASHLRFSTLLVLPFILELFSPLPQFSSPIIFPRALFGIALSIVMPECCLTPNLPFLEIVGNHLIENPSYPKRKRITAPVPAIARTASGTVLDLTDAPVVSRNASGLELGRAPAVDYDNTTIAVSSAYREMCSAQLQNEFPWLGVPAIKKIMVETNDHYTPARKKLRAMVGEIPDMWPEHARPPNPTVKVLSKKRNPVSMPAERDEGFIRELAWARREDELARADRDWAMQKELNDKATEEEQTIECSCCCCDYPFSDVRLSALFFSSFKSFLFLRLLLPPY